MRYLAVLLGFSVLAGCAGVYSEGAVPGAMAAYQLNVDRCEQRGDIGLGQAFQCILAADRQFAADIKLKRADLFNAYVGRMTVLYEDATAKRVNAEELKARYIAIRRDYIRSIDQAADIDAEQRARFAAGMAAMGDAMERQADRQAYINAQNRPLNCTSTAFGSTVNTRCN